jgi:ABC-type glutathione transport system ATPase component
MFLIPRFSLDLPQEPPTIIDSNRVPAYWPSSSDNDTLLIVENLVIRYAPDLPAVLQNVSFSLKARERVGLLGRTGSWTLRCILELAVHTFFRKRKIYACDEHPTIRMLFRTATTPSPYIYVQVDPTSGRILVDGIDISTIGIHDLRSRLVRMLYMLPQAVILTPRQTFIPQASAPCMVWHRLTEFCKGCHSLFGHCQRKSRSIQ